jgi:hypothetical protein
MFSPFGVSLPLLPKQMKEEEEHAKKHLEACKSIEASMQECMKNYFLIKEKLFVVALFFYIYTNPQESSEQVFNEILARRKSAKREANLTYFFRYSEIKGPIIAFHLEFFPIWNEVKKYYCLALAKDCADFECDKEIASVLRKMFITALESPSEVEARRR